MTKKFKEKFAAHGINESSLIFEGNSPKKEYFESYGKIDIALDPFPYNGGTTSLDSLWMGVPIITLKGDRLMGRVGTSYNKSLGFPEFIAYSHEEYVEKAVELANNVEKLEAISKNLREKLKKSASFDYEKFIIDFEKLLKNIWRKHLENQKKAS